MNSFENCTPWGNDFWKNLVYTYRPTGATGICSTYNVNPRVLHDFDLGHAYLLGTGSRLVAVQCLDNGKPPKELIRITLVAPNPAAAGLVNPGAWKVLSSSSTTEAGIAIFEIGDGEVWPDEFRIRLASLGYHYQDVIGHLGLQIVNLIPDPYYCE